MTVNTPIVERRAIKLLATQRSYSGELRSTNLRKIASQIVGSNADKDLLIAVISALSELADDENSRVVWADHDDNGRYTGDETDNPKRIQLRHF